MEEAFQGAERVGQVGGGMKVASLSVQPAGPIQFWLVRNSPGVRRELRAPASSLAWISRIRRTETGSVASRSRPWFIAVT